MLDYHLIVDMISLIAQLYLTNCLQRLFILDGLQQAVLMSIGLQTKTLGDVGKELSFLPRYVLVIFHQTIRMIATCFQHLLCQAISETLL